MLLPSSDYFLTERDTASWTYLTICTYRCLNPIKVHYTIKISAPSKRVIESSRERRNLPFEFVVGSGQVIKGWDVAIKKMSRGERSNVSISSPYAYGETGIASIPPNTNITCDIELINYWRKPTWFKPWIQHKPFSVKSERDVESG
mmetsp:Transcript_16477/g.24169  ORF Transcript_16477/g.24169 Transcript_16477/m.24169 type:complete len:146 (+) Transcript_16477:1499-1936(+)